MSKKLSKQLEKLEAERSVLRNEHGALGYILAWFMGVPAVVLLVIYLIAN